MVDNPSLCIPVAAYSADEVTAIIPENTPFNKTATVASFPEPGFAGH
jgi:hypothetical protein